MYHIKFAEYTLQIIFFALKAMELEVRTKISKQSILPPNSSGFQRRYITIFCYIQLVLNIIYKK